MHEQLVTLKEKAKLEIASYDPFKVSAGQQSVDAKT